MAPAGICRVTPVPNRMRCWNEISAQRWHRTLIGLKGPFWRTPTAEGDQMDATTVAIDLAKKRIRDRGGGWDLAHYRAAAVLPDAARALPFHPQRLSRGH